MEAIERFLLQGVYYFMDNWVAAAILAGVLIFLAVKKPKELFKGLMLLAFMVGVFYVMVYLEKSMFSGVSSKQRAVDIERQAK